jgi:hypothetical protein
MNMKVSGCEGGGPGSDGAGKKPYQKPSFRYEEVFVTSALTCSKVSGSICDQIPTPRSS